MNRSKRTDPLLTIPHYWQELPAGVHYQQALQAHIDPWWPKIFGTRLLKLGDLSADLCFKRCGLLHQAVLSLPSRPLHNRSETAERDDHLLPFKDNFFDACLLVHTLSYVTNPRKALHEADRVLANHGWLLISGFNPHSILGIGKLLPLLRQHQPYCYPFISRQRVLDWLSLLNYNVLSQTVFQVWPWGMNSPIGAGLEHCLAFVGCQYLVVARKQLIPLNTVQRTLRYQPVWSGTTEICQHHIN